MIRLRLLLIFPLLLFSTTQNVSGQSSEAMHVAPGQPAPAAAQAAPPPQGAQTLTLQDAEKSRFKIIRRCKRQAI